jgi:carboxypeptidase Q
MRFHRFVLGATTLMALLAPTALPAQIASESLDLDVVAQIRVEGLENSQIEALAHHLTDVIGPRLTGSPGMRQANDWTAAKFEEWGLANAAVEPWGEFGRGWERVRYEGTILEPFSQPLNAQPVGWTGGTNGRISGPAVVVPGGFDSLASFTGSLAGAFVMLREPTEITPEFEHRDRRTPIEQLLEPAPGDRPNRRGGRGPINWDSLMTRIADAQARQDTDLRTRGVALILTPSSRPNGIIRGGGKLSGRYGRYDDPLPELVVSQEQYNEIYRNVTEGRSVTLEVDVETRFYDDDLTSYNTVADIPGGDLADEFVMIGAHLDSWHYGTGATDNGAGSIVMMEAMRILKTLGVTPRRTIRIGLWSGEEQGLWGSREYLADHPELHDKISAYLNVDNGTGKIRGIWNQKNEAASPIFEQTLWPFRDLGVVTVRNGNTGGTDHLSFDAAGIPGFNFIQDPIEYGINTHHTNLDTYDHIVIEDLMQAAVVVAATAYHLAMRDEMVPRKAPATP